MLFAIAITAAAANNPSALLSAYSPRQIEIINNFNSFKDSDLFAPPHQPCNGASDPFCHSGCDCESFCKGSCAINATKPKNITVYRMTYRDVLTLAEKNSGDLDGDLSFVLGRRTQAFQCRQNPHDFQCQGLAVFSGDDPNSTDLVLEMKVEIDGNFGPYLYCNPNNVSVPDGDWACTTELNFAAGGNISGACSDQFEVIPGRMWHFREEPAPKILKDVYPEECCDLSKSTGTLFWNYYHNNRTCVYGGYPRQFVSNTPNGNVMMALDRKFTGKPCNCSRVFHSVGRENLTTVFGASPQTMAQYPLGGIWLSHPAKGECKEGQRVGEGCSWRLVETTVAINASCMYKNVDANVESLDRKCFDECPDPKNKTSTCYLRCFSHVTSTADHEALRRPWLHSINGGCPRVHLP